MCIVSLTTTLDHVMSLIFLEDFGQGSLVHYRCWANSPSLGSSGLQTLAELLRLSPAAFIDDERGSNS